MTQVKPKTILVIVAGFVAAHFLAWLFFFLADLYSANGVMHRYYVEVQGYPRDWMDIGRMISSFPVGPFSSVLWGGVLYLALALLSRGAAKTKNGTLA